MESIGLQIKGETLLQWMGQQDNLIKNVHLRLEIPLINFIILEGPNNYTLQSFSKHFFKHIKNWKILSAKKLARS